MSKTEIDLFVSESLRRRALLRDVFFLIVLLYTISSMVITFFVLENHVSWKYASTPMHFFVAVMVSMTVFFVGKGPGMSIWERFLDRFNIQWVMEVGDNIIKVHGSIPLSQWWRVRDQMLAVRPGYVSVVNAWEKYGALMAAVPATEQEQGETKDFQVAGTPV